MKKYLFLIALWLAFLVPDLAQAANRFAVCTTTCTWDNTSTAMWSTTSGGGTGASAPVAADDVILDAATCVGGTTCTITTFSGTISIKSLTQSACTASTSGCILESSTNNTNFTIVDSYTNTGSGTRTLNMGTGTWTITSNSGLWNIASSMTLSAASSTIAFSVGGNTRQFVGANKTYGTLSVTGASGGLFGVLGNNTIGTLTVSSPIKLRFQSGSNNTITTFTNTTGAGATPILVYGDGGVATITSANNWTCTWCGFFYTTFTGGGTFTGTNSLNFGDNTGITITAPATGSGGGRIIGG